MLAPTTNTSALAKLRQAGPDNNGGLSAPSYLQQRTQQPTKPVVQPLGETPADRPPMQIDKAGTMPSAGKPMSVPQGAPQAGTNGASAFNGTPQMAVPTNLHPAGGSGIGPMGTPQLAVPQGLHPTGFGGVGGMTKTALMTQNPAEATPTAPGGVSPMQPAAGANAPVPLNDIQSLVEKQLGDPSRYDAKAVQDAYDYMKQDLTRTRDTGLSSADADAANRGVFYGTPATSARSNVEAQYNRGLGDLASNLAISQAQTYGEDANTAFQHAMSLFGAQNTDTQTQAQIAAIMAELGQSGAPTVNNATNVNVPPPSSTGTNTAAMQALGALLAGNNNTVNGARVPKGTQTKDTNIYG